MSLLCKNKVNWLFKLEKNYSWESGLRLENDYVYFDANKNKVRLIVEKNGRITITKGYCWNGCSPKVCIFDINVGTPDGVVHRKSGRPKTYFASLVHDALYQFRKVDAPYTRRQADACFLRLMKDSDFCLRNFYWAAVRLF